MHCETLLRFSTEEVNFTSVRKTNIALSVLKSKQLQWTTTVCKNCKKWRYISTGGLRSTPTSRMGKILLGLAQWTGGRTPLPPNPSSWAFRLRTLPGAVNYVLLAEDFWIFLAFPRYNMSNYGRRAFRFAGPYVWNSLPENIRQSTSIAVFKRSLKTFLLQQISHLAHYRQQYFVALWAI